MSDVGHGFGRTLADEYRRVVRPPWEIPTVLLVNGTTMVAAWVLLPPRAHDLVFSLNGPLAFPVVLASWLLADTPATNALGANPDLALSVLRRREAHLQWLAARCVVLGSLVGLPCAVAMVVIGVGSYSVSEVLWACALVLLLPVGILPVTAWLGILFPFRVRTLRWRWDHRRVWLVQLRWVALLLAPFVVVPFVGGVILAPAVAVARAAQVPGQRLSEGQFGLAAALGCVMALLVGALGLWGARPLLARRADRLSAYLAAEEVG